MWRHRRLPGLGGTSIWATAARPLSGPNGYGWNSGGVRLPGGLCPHFAGGTWTPPAGWDACVPAHLVDPTARVTRPTDTGCRTLYVCCVHLRRPRAEPIPPTGPQVAAGIGAGVVINVLRVRRSVSSTEHVRQPGLRLSDPPRWVPMHRYMLLLVPTPSHPCVRSF